MNRRTLLLVEDDALIRLDMADIVGDLGFAVLEAPNAESAITLLETHSEIVAVITDVDLPGTMDGLELVRVIARRWPPCRLIVISGKHRPTVADLPGGSRFLSKPASERDVGNTLRELGLTL